MSNQQQTKTFEERRVEFHNLLKQKTGINNIYYQAGSNLKYPCIRYALSRVKKLPADNKGYVYLYPWEVIVITTSAADNSYIDTFNDFNNCTMDRAPYFADNLYHYAYTIYY